MHIPILGVLGMPYIADGLGCGGNTDLLVMLSKIEDFWTGFLLTCIRYYQSMVVCWISTFGFVYFAIFHVSCCIDLTCLHIQLCLISIFCVGFWLSLVSCLGNKRVAEGFQVCQICSFIYYIETADSSIHLCQVFRIVHMGAVNLNDVLWYMARLEDLTFYCGDFALCFVDIFIGLQ